MEKSIAKDLLSIGAVFLRPEQPFTWASGIKSPIYCDNRLTLTAPEVRNHVEEGLAELIRKGPIKSFFKKLTTGTNHKLIVTMALRRGLL